MICDFCFHEIDNSHALDDLEAMCPCDCHCTFFEEDDED